MVLNTVSIVTTIHFCNMDFFRNAAASTMSMASSVTGIGQGKKETDDEGNEQSEIDLGPAPEIPVMTSFKEGSLESRYDEDSESNTWNQISHSIFELRTGPDYARNKTKGPSPPALCQLMGIDLFRFPKRVDNIGSRIKFPQAWLAEDMLGHDVKPEGVPKIFIVNVQIPTANLTQGGITSFFTDKDDGEGISVVYYFKLTEETNRAIIDGDSAAKGESMKRDSSSTSSSSAHLFGRFLREAVHSQGESADPWKGRFKVILSCSNMDDFGLPGFITQYNAKPVLIRSTGKLYSGENYVEQVINVHAFGLVAKKGIGLIQSKVPFMHLDSGFCIESRENEEMPECLLGCGGLNKIIVEHMPSLER